MTTNTPVLPTGTSEPGTPSTLAEREPLITASTITGLVLAVCGIAGWRITNDNAVLIGTVGVMIVHIVATALARAKVTSPATLKLMQFVQANLPAIIGRLEALEAGGGATLQNVLVQGDPIQSVGATFDQAVHLHPDDVQAIASALAGMGTPQVGE